MRKNEGPVGPRDPGWYPDPWSADGTGERYFDGTKWAAAVTTLDRRTKKRFEKNKRQRARPPRATSSVRSVVLVVVLGAAAWAYPRYERAQVETPESQRRPPPSAEEASKPLGHPQPVPEGRGKFEVLLEQPEEPGTPVAFDPCRPVHYVVNAHNAPDDGLEMIHGALARIQAATGLKFVYDGETDEKPDKQRMRYQPDRYDDDRWAPVLIAWEDEDAFPSIAGYIAGVGGPESWITESGDLAYVSGLVVLDSVDLSAESAPNREGVRAVILHELGHLVGLDHTSDDTQLMYSEDKFNVLDFGVGDLRGLAKLGTQACYPDL